MSDCPAPPDRIAVVVDLHERETRLFDLLVACPAFDVRLAKLPAGDYRVTDAILVERKTALDFAMSLVDGRLFTQAARLAQQDARGLFLLEGALPPAAPRIHPHALKGALVSLAVMWRLPVIHARDPEESLLVLRLLGEQALKAPRGILRRVDPKPKRLTSRKLFVLQALPGVGPALSRRLLGTFGSVQAAMNASEDALLDVRGIGDARAAAIRNVLG